jgi:hypothetical protein
MKWVAFFLLLLTLAPGCVLEDKPVDPGVDGGAGSCTPPCSDDTPFCTAESECVACTPEADDYCTDMAQVCKSDGVTCVDCNGSAECDDPDAAHCDAETNECESCEGDSDCNGIGGLPRCPAGTCVECTPANEATDCLGTSCDPRTFACTGTDVGSRETCETCVADSECGEEGNASEQHRCVEMFYDGDQYPDEDAGFCLKVFSPGGCEQPYAIRISDRDSLSGEPVQSYCGINETLATCPAVRALDQNQECPGGEDVECPTAGLCRDVGGLSNRCTYLCGDETQCDKAPNPGSTCGSSGSGSDDYCGG